MTDPQQTDWRDKFWSMFEPDPNHVYRAQTIQGFAKTFFDYLRNLTIVGALKLLSEKTGSTGVEIVFLLANCVLWMQTIAYVISWRLKIFRHLDWGKKGETLDIIIDLVLATILLIAANVLIALSVAAIASTPKP